MILTIILIATAIYISITKYQKQTFRVLSAIAGPFVRLYILRRISKGLEDKNRKNERFGIPSCDRPSGKLIWIHAVSVGETLSIIPFIEEFKKINKNINVLLTTTTLTASKLVKERLGDSVIHQFATFDIFMWDRRFIKYWKPDVAFFIESEIWPNILYYLYEKDIPVYLLNTRISKKTLKRLYFVKKFFRILPFSLFTKVFVPSDEIKKYVKDLGARDVEVAPNIKIISKKLNVNEENAKILKQKINNRKVWIAVSSHKGEEEIILETHKKLKEIYPDILTFIAIRHPKRSEEVSSIFLKSGLSCAFYSNVPENEEPITEDVYIIDKIGCLGEFFTIVDTVLVCGSLIDGIGGHNMLEPMNFMCNVAVGPYIENFRDIYPYVEKYCKKVSDSDEITKFVNESIKSYRRNPDRIKYIDFTQIWTKAVKQIYKTVYNES